MMYFKNSMCIIPSSLGSPIMQCTFKRIKRRNEGGYEAPHFRINILQFRLLGHIGSFYHLCRVTTLSRYISSGAPIVILLAVPIVNARRRALDVRLGDVVGRPSWHMLKLFIHCDIEPWIVVLDNPFELL